MQSIILPTILLAATSLGAAAQDTDRGKSVFRKCAACHQIGEYATNRTGSVLTGVVGRAAGSVVEFEYSESMQAANAAGLVWTENLIFDYLANPTAFLRDVLDDPKASAKMTFRLGNAQDRRDVIAYLASFRTAAAVPETKFCIVNATDAIHLFVTETREGDRQMAELAPGERLCSAETLAPDGVISVFEDPDGFEGCSRIVPVGSAEDLLDYAEFDRCRWGSHNY